MRKRPTIAVAAVVVVALVAAAALVTVRWWRDAHRSDLERATSYAPSDAQRLSWTDWAGVREEVGADLDASSSGDALEDFLDDGYDDDLTSASALVGSASVLQAHFGFSPASLDWELLAQSERGAVVILRPSAETDLDDVAGRLREIGFGRPSSADGVWTGGETLLPGIGSGLTPELQYVALDAEDHLILTSDTREYLQQVLDDRGDADVPEPVSEVAAASGEPLSAAVYSGAHTCSALAMGRADAADQELADRLVDRAGGVDPVTAFAMSVQPDGHVRTVLAFEDDDQARGNARARSALAGGPAPGQGGEFGDRFSVGRVAAEGPLVTMDLVPRRGSPVFSDLSTGPVLFATC